MVVQSNIVQAEPLSMKANSTRDFMFGGRALNKLFDGKSVSKVMLTIRSSSVAINPLAIRSEC